MRRQEAHFNKLLVITSCDDRCLRWHYPKDCFARLWRVFASDLWHDSEPGRSDTSVLPKKP